jgi:hypothetical protein
MKSLRGYISLGCLFVLALPCAAQSDLGFQFVRIKYTHTGTGWINRFGESWSHDHPTAEENFYEALERTTHITLDGPPLVLRLSDEKIFEYPLLYLCEPGFWKMDSDEEAENLREYLERGGFILFDDFRGIDEWIALENEMSKVLPDRAFIEIPPEHPIWSIYYDIDPVAAPALASGTRGHLSDQYRAILDDNGRIMALACYNQDIGDGWEWPDRNFEEASTISFQMGVNFLIYALTH